MRARLTIIVLIVLAIGAVVPATSTAQDKAGESRPDPGSHFYRP